MKRGSKDDQHQQWLFDNIEPVAAGTPDKVSAAPASVYVNNEPPPPLPGDFREMVGKKSRIRHPRENRGPPVKMPVPIPLPESVSAGHFGYDERGVILPSREEVWEITDTQARQLIDYLLDLQSVEIGDVTTRTRFLAEYQQVLTNYAESFGQEASRKLDIYARQQAMLDSRYATPSILGR